MLAATLFLYGILILFNRLNTTMFLGAIGVSSISATTFTVFAIPQSNVAVPGRIIGAYLIASIMGLFCHYLTPLLHLQDPMLTTFRLNYALGGALAVALSMFFMVLAEADHPPAAGFAVGLVFSPFSPRLYLAVFIAIIILATIRYCFRRHLINFL